ncbi:ribonuclease H-like domain-containing protein [Cerioporus squamosus]|nr:ribonuclease H-like domain-containing protein [Cerioporus squamosus]
MSAAEYTLSKQTPSNQLSRSGRAWYRSHFYDHPDYFPQRPAHSKDGDKTKVWCKKCFEQRVEEEKLGDIRQGVIRETEEIEKSLWALDKLAVDRSRRWIAAAGPALLVHLIECPLISPEVSQRASREHEEKNKSPRRLHRNSVRMQAHPEAPAPQPTIAPMYFPFPTLVHPAEGASESVASTSTTPLPSLSPLVLSGLSTSFESRTNTPVSYSASASLPFPPSAASTPGLPTVSPAGSLRRRYDSGLDAGSPQKRPRYDSRSAASRGGSSGNVAAAPAWDGGRQELFEAFLGRLTASQGWSLSWVENPIWLEFCDTFLPDANIPSRKVLTQRIIPNQVVHFRGIAQKTCRGKLVTVQCDGFTACNRHHIVAFMITVGGRVYSVRTFDTSTEPKTAEFLIRMMRQVIELVEKDWGARVIAMTSDCSGESRLARELLVERVVTDYFKANADFFQWTKQADEVIQWLRSHNYLLGILNEIQLNMPRNANGDPPTALSVIRGVLTRWTSNYLAYRRVLQLRIPLELLAVDNRIFLSGKEESHQRTRKMLKILKNPLFWHGIARVKLHLEPLAIAAHITQSNSCRLDDVVLTFGFLYRYFDNLVQEDPDDAPVRSAVLKSLTMRWDAADQDAMIGAAVLNPYLKRNLFDLDLHQYFSYARIEDLLCRLWDRFFPDEPEARPDHKMVTDYLQATGLFEVMPSTADSVKANAEKEKPKRTPNPIDVWERIFNSRQKDKTSAQDDDSAPSLLPSQTTTNPRAPPLLHSLYRLAVYVLSICPTAANCEQLFSVLGIIMSDRRTRLTMDNLMNIAELRLHLRDEHVRKNTKARLKRHFGERISRPEVNTSEESSSSRNADTGRPAQSRTAEAAREMLGGLESLIEHFSSRGDDDDELRTSNRWPSKLRIPLSKMFDFQSDFWSAYMARTHTNSLDEELAVWDLLDMDGDGEEDTGMDELAGILIAG